MREILFRGKRITDGKWITDRPTYIKRDDDTWLADDCVIVRAIPETVGQYTGLTDKNGTKIFEGDVVNILTENNEIGIVKYDEGGFEVEADGFVIDFKQNINGTDVEVIGNIYDNPELLKGE